MLSSHSLHDLFAPAGWREALVSAPVIALILGIGFALGTPLPAVVAAGAAFSVGFGALRAAGRRCWQIMFGTAAGLVLAAFAGSLAGHSLIATLVGAAGLAAICGGLALYQQDWWWLVLQITIAFVVASYYPNDLNGALHRGALVAAGGLAQVLSVTLLRWLWPAAVPKVALAPPGSPERWLVVGHAARSAVAVGAAVIIARGLGLEHNYWAPMTALLILKPGLLATRTRGLARIAGTLLGSLCSTGFALITGLWLPMMIAAITGAAFGAYTFRVAHYAVFTFFVTATIVLMLDLVHGHPLANASQRIIATLLGAGIAIICAIAAPASVPAPGKDRVLDHAPGTETRPPAARR
ncbi:MAG: FUSC family protein [Paracoccus sp. (in: a-proteobacteria)]|nr:FUSC family protein [Paracoccus sp. (in: a-proteobacteria)]